MKETWELVLDGEYYGTYSEDIDGDGAGDGDNGIGDNSVGDGWGNGQGTNVDGDGWGDGWGDGQGDTYHYGEIPGEVMPRGAQ